MSGDLLEPAENDFGDWESDDDAAVEVRSLFDGSRVFPSVAALMEHDLSVWGFSLADAARQVGMGDLSTIMLVNFVRRRVAEHQSSSAAGVDAAFVERLKEEIATREFLEREEFMIPVLQDDPLLYLLQDALGMADDYSDEEKEGVASALSAASASAAASAGELIGGDAGAGSPPDINVEALRLEMTKYKSIITALTSETAPESQGSGQQEVATPGDDSYYFDSYSQVAIHETMLRDGPRTGSYAAALSTPGFLKGKVVLDVGCGTGILCMLAARAGAKKVIGIDLSSMIEQSRRIVDKNGFGDVVTLIRGRMEETALPVEEVDVIVSEWMGYGLYFENMVASVLHARKEYLAPGGVLMPSHALIYIEALASQGEDDRVGWWSNVYGFDMSPCSWMLTREAQVQLVSAEDVVSNRALIHSLDMNTAEEEDLDFSAPFELHIKTDGPVRALVVSFDVDFRFPVPAEQPTVTLSTGAQSPDTHWKQTVLWLRAEFVEQWTSGQVLRGSLEYRRRADNLRDYDLVLTWTPRVGGDQRTQTFALASS